MNLETIAFGQDAPTAAEVQASWNEVFLASNQAAQCRMTYVLKKGNAVARTEFHTFARDGERLLLASCYSATSEYAGGRLTLFDGTNESSAQTGMQFEAPSDQQAWSTTGIRQVEEPDFRVAASVGNLEYAGIKIGGFISFGYFDLNSERIIVSQISQALVDGKELVKLDYQSDYSKCQNKGFNASTLTSGTLWLDPLRAFLPIKAESLFSDGERRVDQFVYQDFNGSWFVKSSVHEYILDLSNRELYADVDVQDLFTETAIEVTFLSDQILPADAFSLTHYGMVSPVTKPKTWFRPWYLLILGTVFIGAAFVYKKRFG